MHVSQIQLEADERVLLTVRKHWFILGTQIFAILTLAVFPCILFVGVSLVAPASLLEKINAGLVVTLYIGWLIIIWMALFSVWTNYYLDVWTVTNKRLIAVDQKGFFFRTTASFRLERLQDIIVSVNGIVATLLNYGSLEIQTAGDEKNFKAFGLPNPPRIKSIILNATDHPNTAKNDL